MNRSNFRQQRAGRNPRAGFTLLEILLALTLSAVVAWLVGSLVQLYFVNNSLGRDRVKQTQLARSLLSMIAEDIRTTVRHQPFDAAGLSQLIGGSSGGSGGGGGAGGAAGGAGGGMSMGPPSGGGVASGGGAASGGAAGGSMSGGSMGSGGASSAPATQVVALPPGIYGTSTSIEIDVSRLPRPDEYVPQGPDVTNGTTGDLPSDIKTVAYYVQSIRSDGVRDPLATEPDIRSTAPKRDGSGGLVRRSIDRAVTQFAYEQGQSDSLLRTGELLASEVIAIEFEYFDGATWQTQWDSSVQGLPLVVRINLAMQLESKAKSDPIDPGMSLSSLTKDMLSQYGIDIYSTTTIIPGAQLLIGPQSAQASGDTGMSSMGLGTQP